MVRIPGTRALGAGAVGIAGIAGTYALGRSVRPEQQRGGGNPFSDLVRGAVAELRFVRGAGAELINVLGHHVHIPTAPKGTIYEPHGEQQRAGARLVDAVGRFVGVVPDPRDPARDRNERPLLHRATVTVGAPGPAILELRAATNSNWGERGRKSVLAAVFVDGKYVSDAVLMGERDTPYRIGLGTLAPGPHEVEVRIAEGSPIDEAAAARVTGIRVVPSDQPLADRYAPILEGRDVGRPGGTPDLASNDAPLLMEPLLTRNPDGTTRIDYHVLYSNEDGGTPIAKLVGKYGRSTDFEAAYSVLLDARGERISDRFQTSRHQWMSFDGRREGDRPVMRIDTDNNLVTAQTRGDGHRWSAATERARTPGSGPGADRSLMNRNPWTWAVMGRELVREGKLGASNSRLAPSEDPRSYLYLTPPGPGDAVKGAEQVHIVLRDGREVDVDLPKRRGKEQVRAIELPAGVAPGAIASVQASAAEAFTLDKRFQPQEIAVRPFEEVVTEDEEPLPGAVEPGDDLPADGPSGADAADGPSGDDAADGTVTSPDVAPVPQAPAS